MDLRVHLYIYFRLLFENIIIYLNMVKNMEPNFDELAQIGMEFTLPRVNNRQATKEEIKHLRENINDDIKKTEEKMISIVMKPDPDYINPDPTGNGISEGMESYEFSVEDEIINAVSYTHLTLPTKA